MNMIPVDSSNLSSVGYENGNLYIRFRSGSTYCYYNVPSNVYQKLLMSGSKGKYHAAHIKNYYSYTKIG